MKKGWKFAFFALLIVFAAFLAVLYGLYQHYLPEAGDSTFSIEGDVEPGKPIFSVSTTKQQLQPMINARIKRYNRMDRIRYKVVMKKDLIIKGVLDFLGSDIEFAMKMEPKVLRNGNMILKEKSIRLGLLQLPVPSVLKYIKDSADLPKSIKIAPKKKEVYVDLKSIHIEDQFYLAAKTFDLKKNKITFAVYTLPETE
ncbi:MAG TPA: YpmS family protein [Bacillales bacterium]|nr:YpmS family protein [Bacillales bacterium]